MPTTLDSAFFQKRTLLPAKSQLSNDLKAKRQLCRFTKGSFQSPGILLNEEVDR